MHYFTHIYAIEMFQKAKLHTPQEQNYVKSKKSIFRQEPDWQMKKYFL